MDEMTVVPWRRYGHERLYVKLRDGQQVGWYDLKAAQPHLDEPAYAAAFDDAVREWLSARVVPVQRPSADLAENRPGAAARAEAVARKEEAPARTALARLMQVHTDERAWRIGANGEEKVAECLAKLGPDWQTLHAVPVGKHGSDIDHVVIGPGGVFTVNSKTHPGAEVWVGGDAFRVSGQRVPYVRNSHFEAVRASKFLSAACGFEVKAKAVIVVVNARRLSVKKQPDDVTVVGWLDIRRWLLRHPEVLSPESAAAVYAKARRSETWI